MTRSILKVIFYSLLLIAGWQKSLLAAVEPYQNQIRGKLKQGDSVIVRDEKFRNPDYDWGRVQNKKVTNVVTFSLYRDTTAYPQQKFSCEVDLKIEYWSNPDQAEPVVIEHAKLEINYDPVKGATFKPEDSYWFQNGHMVKVTVNSISCPELGDERPPIFRITNKIVVERKYHGVPDRQLLPSFSISQNDESGGNPMARNITPTPVGGTLLHLTWDKIEAAAEQYDIEYTFIDDESPNGKILELSGVNTPHATLAKMFRNNATRATVSEENFTISLVNNTKYLLVRIRTVDEDNGLRTEGDWVYDMNQGGSAVSAVIILSQEWFHPNFNWQYNATFAEDGKRQETITFLDGSSRTRQTLMAAEAPTNLANADDHVIVQSQVYDEFGRPLLQTMPIPVQGKELSFKADDLYNGANNRYNFADAYGGSSASCILKPLPVNTSLGKLGSYYSANNAFLPTAAGERAADQAERPYKYYVPNAGGYPFSVTRYTNDNTNRVAVQGGVGELFQPGAAGKATQMFYGKPGQWELDRVFGNDVGYASHYLKNMTVDGNGQVSVSYLNASGKVIATALAGAKPDNLNALSSTAVGVTREVFNMLEPADFTFDESRLMLTGSGSYLASNTGNAVFTYQVDQLIKQYNESGVQICSNCYYKLNIRVTDDCGKLVGRKQADVGRALADCDADGIRTDTVQTNISRLGTYNVSFELSLSEDAIRNYTETYIAQNTNLKSAFQFAYEQLQTADFTNCINDCRTCAAVLGAKPNFIARLSSQLEANNVDLTGNTALFNSWAGSLYDNLSAKCTALINSNDCQPSPCDGLKRQLILDISPGGQYALFDAEGNVLEPATNILALHFRQVFPRTPDNFGAWNDNKFKLDDGTEWSPNDASFTEADLVTYWREEWAEKFVVHHPEYCAFQSCQTNEVYRRWDSRINSMALTDDDLFNILGVRYNATQVEWLLAKDPFFAVGAAGYPYRSEFGADLIGYSTRVLGVNASSLYLKSLSAFVNYSLYCANETFNTNTLAAQGNSWNQCTPDASCRVVNKEWDMYRQKYMELKEKYYQRSMAEGPCSGKCPVGTLTGNPAKQYCLPPADFRIESEGGLPTDPFHRLVLKYAATVSTNTVINFTYPAQYSSLFKVDAVMLDAGQHQVAFNVDREIDPASIVISSIECQALPSTYPCPGTAGSADMPSTTVQTGSYFEYPENGSIKQYWVVSGTRIGGPKDYCKFQVSDFYDCYTVKVANRPAIHYSNVWVSSCTKAPDAETAFAEPELPVNSNVVESSQSSSLPVDPNCPNQFVLQGTRTEGTDFWYYELGYSEENTVPIGDKTVKIVLRTNHDTYASFFFDNDNDKHSFYVGDSTNISLSFFSISCVDVTSCAAKFGHKISRAGVPGYEFIVPATANDVTQQQGQALNEVVTNARATCEGMADGWMKQFEKYLQQNGINTNTRDLLRQKLVEVCQLGADLEHMAGASTLPSGRATAEGYSSFEDVIRGVLNMSALDMDCNPWLIEAPLPYDIKPQANVLEVDFVNADICAKLAALESQYNADPVGTFAQYVLAKFGSAMKLTPGQLAALQKGCTNCRYILDETLALPVFLDPSAQGCVTATDFSAAMSALSSSIPDWSAATTHEHYRTILTNFLNQRWGFTMGYEDYAAYIQQLATNPSTTNMLCNRPIYADVPGEDPFTCLLNVVDDAAYAGRKAYMEYIDGHKRAFRKSYIAYCGNNKPTLLADVPWQVYHYTLYYYDQAGNLVRTVPPQGVEILTVAQRQAVTAARLAQSQQCNYGNGPASNTVPENAYTALGNALRSETPAAMEMWLYNAATSANGTQMVMTAGVDEYIVSYCINNNQLSLDIFKVDPVTKQTSSALTYRTAVNIQQLLPLDKWIHVVAQGNNLLRPGLSVSVNGILCPPIASPTPAVCSWTITSQNGQFIYPQRANHLKHLRIYNRLLTDAEIEGNATQYCFGVSPGHAADLQSARVFWGRFNTPANGIEPAGPGGGTPGVQPEPFYPSHTLPTSYAFQSLGGVTTQRSPDAGTSKFWYDKLGRLVFSQNQEQQTPVNLGASNRYSYTVYDGQSRIVQVGEKTVSTSPTTNTHFLADTTIGNIMAGGTRSQITKTLYDAPYTAAALNEQENLRKRVSATSFEEVENTVEQYTYYSYDQIGNVKALWHKLPGLTDKKKIDYDYDLASGKVNMVGYERGEGDQFYYGYEYDARNRLVAAKTGLTPNSAINWATDASYEYYLHQPLARMVLGKNAVQGLDYVYTLQGWLKKINSSKLDPQTDIGGDGQGVRISVPRDVFGYSINYYGGDYQPIAPFRPLADFGWQPGTGTSAGVNLYNGNIASTTLALNSHLPQNVFQGQTTGYTYRYDQLNRLVKMRQDQVATSATNWSGTEATAYGENINYDANGNIQFYKRYGATPDVLIDDLTYHYVSTPDGKKIDNRLNHIKDIATTPAGQPDLKDQNGNNYLYDNIGNLRADVKENITRLEWSVYGKLRKIAKNNQPYLEYKYDGAGNRVYKWHNNGGQITETWYVRDAQGNPLSIYEKSGGTTRLKEQVLYGSSRLGSWYPEAGKTATESWNTEGNKLYELSNHLGNVMAVVSDELHPGAELTADVRSMQDYYPFGMVQPGRSLNVAGYRYGFNGKENDNEVGKGDGGQQDYGMRVYDARVGRFLSVDPLIKKYPELTPYQFASNTPIQASDLDGLEADFSKGKVQKMEYASSDAWYHSAGKFTGNTAISIWNGAVGSVEMVANLNPIYNLADGGNGYKKIWGDISSTAVAGYNWTVNTTLEQKGRDLKKIATDPHTYEDVLAMVLVSKGMKSVGAAKPAVNVATTESVEATVATTTQAATSANQVSAGANAANNVARGTNNPAVRNAVNLGNRVHYDQLNGGTGVGLPTELTQRYPNTQFSFTPRGAAGADVRVTGGLHPSQYPNSNWAPNNFHADFKPGTPSGARTFRSDVRSGKLPTNTQLLTYDPATGALQ
ncbi:hypothetical protein MKQ68_10820 [Chitinophaga horti]|uniref:DUF6443 domain-containing protein n=1 Tax=Chitinophaga horti TaxID=2920382 RepID=A0ABY6J7G9_9BACT|nr:RHS repeat-associated core domain-containing protein [Chitinophaga horti]UYQ95593.1 hypothetical protein MKQ68_10820 [Chitinophaga horti]